ncbi:MAG: hypothetical protein SFU98_00090 [Leptospiraceae bacterium]|nr:hypothetical protein [Leptospiraceae bacterium]
MSGKLKNRYIFISASFPSKEQGVEYLQDFVPMLTMDAVSAISREIFQAGGKIVNGGHPTILPFMYSIGEEFKSKRKKDFPLISVYQTEYFRDKQTISSKKLSKNKIGEFIWIPESDNPPQEEKAKREDALAIMRNAMYEHKDIVAGIFIAGMKGIKDEFDLFQKSYPEKPFYVIGSC